MLIIIVILTIRKPCVRQSSIGLNYDENSGMIKTIVIEETHMERAKTPRSLHLRYLQRRAVPGSYSGTLHCVVYLTVGLAGK